MRLVGISRSEMTVLDAVTLMLFKKAEEEREKAFKKPAPRTTRTAQKARSEEI